MSVQDAFAKGLPLLYANDAPKPALATADLVAFAVDLAARIIRANDRPMQCVCECYHWHCMN